MQYQKVHSFQQAYVLAIEIFQIHLLEQQAANQRISI